MCEFHFGALWAPIKLWTSFSMGSLSLRACGKDIFSGGVGNGCIGDMCIHMPWDGFGNVGFELLILLWYCNVPSDS